MEDYLHWKTASILKVEYLSNRWLDLPPILILSSEDETKIKKNPWKEGNLQNKN